MTGWKDLHVQDSQLCRLSVCNSNSICGASLTGNTGTWVLRIERICTAGFALSQIVCLQFKSYLQSFDYGIQEQGINAPEELNGHIGFDYNFITIRNPFNLCYPFAIGIKDASKKILVVGLRRPPISYTKENKLIKKGS